jgi:hypothetical protein
VTARGMSQPNVYLGQRFTAPSGRRYKVATIDHGNRKVFMAALDPVSETDRGLWVRLDALVDWRASET